MADLTLNINGADGLSSVLGSVGGAFAKLGQLAAECSKAFEQQAKADRQLARYAGENTAAFKAQASAMQESLGVSDDMVQSMQTMLLRFGEAPDQVEATTKAILDYSAATGEDAVSATRTLLTSVESGKTAFKDLGLQYEKTGHASQDLINVTKAMAQTLGGSAEEEAKSLTGAANKAKEQLGELKEVFGELISDVAAKTGVLSSAASLLKDIAMGAKLVLGQDLGPGIENKGMQLAAEFQRLQNMKAAWGDDPRFEESIRRQTQIVNELQAAVVSATIGKARVNLGLEKDTIGGLAKPDRLTQKGQKAAAKAFKATDVGESYAEEQDRIDENLRLASERNAREHDERELKREQEANEKLLEEAKRADREEAKRAAKAQKDWEEREEKKADAQLKAIETTQKKLAAQNEKFEAEMAAAGVSIAMALINNLNDAINKSLAGEEVDGVEVGLDVLGTVLQVAGTLVGTYFGGAAGGAVGGALGGLVGTGAKAFYKSQKKRHDGGWIEPQRYHLGGWAGMGSDEEAAILQRGERVWSRAEVSRAGGPAAVDSMARGGGGAGVTVYVQTMDAVSYMGFMGDRGGDGFRDAVMVGRGQLARLAYGGSIA